MPHRRPDPHSDPYPPSTSATAQAAIPSPRLPHSRRFHRRAVRAPARRDAPGSAAFHQRDRPGRDPLASAPRSRGTRRAWGGSRRGCRDPSARGRPRAHRRCSPPWHRRAVRDAVARPRSRRRRSPPTTARAPPAGRPRAGSRARRCRRGPGPRPGTAPRDPGVRPDRAARRRPRGPRRRRRSARRARAVLDDDPADHQRALGAERVDVVPQPDADHRHACRGEVVRGAREILGLGDLQVRPLPGHDDDTTAGGLHHRSIVGALRLAFVRGPEHRSAEGLGGLHRHEILPRHRLDHDPVGGALHRVGHGQSGDRAVRARCGRRRRPRRRAPRSPAGGPRRARPRSRRRRARRPARRARTRTRVAPPVTTVTPARSHSASLGTATTTPSHERRARSTAWSITRRSPRGRTCFTAPKRVPLPAATTIAHTDMGS